MPASSASVPDLEDTSDRQAALRRYHILDTAPEKNFDRITSLVAKVCDVPTSLITLIDKERQWFKSCFGFDARETDVSVSFCIHAVHQGEMLVVEDATKDPRFKDNPIVTGPPHIRFYAGAPLTTPEGIHIGSLCIIDYEPRTFDAAQREILDRLADVVVNQFELRSAEAQVRQLVEHNPQPMYVYSQHDNSILYANEAAGEQYGYNDLSGLTASDLEASSEDQPSSDALSMHERADGSFFPVRLRERNVLYDGRAAVLAVPQAVTNRRDTDTTVFFQTDLEGTTQSLSKDWEDLTGFSIGDTVGSSFLDFVHPLDRSSTTEVFSALLNGEVDTCEHETSILTEESAQSFDLHARLVRDSSGAPTGVSGTLTPVIEQDATAAPAPSDDTEDSAETPPATAETNGTDDSPVADEANAAPLSDADPDPSADEEASSSTVEPDADEGAPEPAPAEDGPAAPSETPPRSEPSPAASPSGSDAVSAENDAEENEPVDAPSAEDDSAEPEPAPAEAHTDAASEPEDDAPEKNSVFSADLPTFAEAEPSSPSAPIEQPSPDDTEADADAASLPTDDRDLRPEPFDLVNRLHNLLDEHETAQGGTVLRRVLPDGSIPVRLDPSATRDVVEALLDTAQAHVGQGTVTVRVQRNDDEVLLDVGSDAMEAPPSSSLQLPRGLAHQMEGTLSVENVAEGGTQIRLTLPRSSAPSGDGSASILSDSPA